MMTKGTKQLTGGWSAVPWLSLALALLVAAAWSTARSTSARGPRVVLADEGGARPEPPPVSAALARRLREELGGIAPAGTIAPARAVERPTVPARTVPRTRPRVPPRPPPAPKATERTRRDK